ncbi:sensor histidine kinase [Cytobacillus sp. FSL W7-1323]|uniref:histidine kinase n=1 Tax=Cytobacillus kochii TaxID=859143 RepID=A0A248TEG4_9BACI|nr:MULTISPECIES: sensor histidine kinase [Cytobacillus]ASV66549.1 sensor histidine kinase [Cytobacillus kochii]MDQ0186781.1 two-component system sensor histidine kinase LytS [Cytobacillus kochii]MEA1854315.1 sensor histidine kinase [Cytobacillus sp. OWB-43]
MFELFITMLERLGIIVTIAFILTRFQFFRDMIYKENVKKDLQLKAILFFGFFGIIGTYTGLSLNAETFNIDRWASNLTSEEAIANSRVIGVVLAGLFGGYKVGLGAGLIAGIHRFTLGGFTAFSCGLATIISGLIAGYFHKKKDHVKLSSAFFIGATAEAVQMLLILLLSRPFEKAVSLVEVIGVPMIIANGVGSALFLLIIKNVVNEEEKAGALQAQKSLRIADQTLSHLRKGMTQVSTKAVCTILLREIHAKAVAITNKHVILAHVGSGDDHHRVDHPIQTEITKEVINNGKLIVVGNEEIQCQNEHCPLGAAVIAPLKQRGQIIGTLKVYFTSEKEVTNLEIELISGLSVLLSNQLEIAEADKAFQLAKEAEIKALQAQISPHFLFNTLNTIVSLVRIDADKARKLLITLSQFLRQNLNATTANRITLEQDILHMKAYLMIEQTRFENRIQVDYYIENEVLNSKIPPLTLQPIVENAIKHAFKQMNKNCMIKVQIKQMNNEVAISIKDNGLGIDHDRLKQIGKEPIASKIGTGLGLYNVNRRLIMTFGENARLHINSEENNGTEITFNIPMGEKNEDKD